MDLISIVSGLLPYVKYSIFIFIALIIGFFLFKKVYQGKKLIRLSKFILILLLICWGTVVLGITTLSRPAMFTGQINPSLFSSYVNAWNKWSMPELQLILFNMLMFVPMGVLLPLIHPKMKRFWRVFIISIVFTLCVEIFQYISGKGIFEFDDLLHNTIGSLAGYFLVMAIMTSIEQRKLKLAPIVKAFAIPLIFVLLFGIASVVYNAQEFGNLAFKPAQKQSMEQIDVQLETQLSNKSTNACMYHNSDVRDINNFKAVSQSISDQFALQQHGGIRMEGENRKLQLIDEEGEFYYLTYFMSNGSWSFSSDAYSEEAPKVDIEQQKRSMEDWLENEDLFPSNATYQKQDERTIRWDLEKRENVQSTCEDFSQGFIVVNLSDKQTPDSIIYDVSDNKLVREKEIIAQQEAYKALLNGEFSLFNPLQKGDKLTITDVRIDYTYDTKGYYQPVYVFNGNVNDPDSTVEILIPAIN
ncbi:MAG: VanZ family protein [Psychrobacillus sp.]